MSRKKVKRSKAPALGGGDDTRISAAMLRRAQDAILRRVKLDRSHEVPYLAGYSRDGSTIYIDRDLPRSFITRCRRVKVDQFLILHEAVEKSLLARLGLVYQHAHQIALRAEEAAVNAAGISWRQYDRFMQKHVKEAYAERIHAIPEDLDLTPYRDEQDWQTLHRMQQAIARERRNGQAAKGMKRPGNGRR